MSRAPASHRQGVFMRSIVRQLSIQLVFLALVVSLAFGFSQFRRNSVKGLVMSSNKPLRSVWVIASQYGAEKGRSLTGDDGKYFIDNLSAGTYDIVVEQAKRQVWRGQVNVTVSTYYNINVKVSTRRR